MSTCPAFVRMGHPCRVFSKPDVSQFPLASYASKSVLIITLNPGNVDPSPGCSLCHFRRNGCHDPLNSGHPRILRPRSEGVPCAPVHPRVSFILHTVNAKAARNGHVPAQGRGPSGHSRRDSSVGAEFPAKSAPSKPSLIGFRGLCTRFVTLPVSIPLFVL